MFEHLYAGKSRNFLIIFVQDCIYRKLLIIQDALDKCMKSPTEKEEYVHF